MKIALFFSVVLFIVLIVISYRGRFASANGTFGSANGTFGSANGTFGSANGTEGFTSTVHPAEVATSESSPIMEYQPNGPDHADLDMQHPYHLLNDRLASSSSMKYAVGSKSCYDADYQQKHNKTGNYSQCTNNYKRDHPDSCSGSRQEFIMNFYQK